MASNYKTFCPSILGSNAQIYAATSRGIVKVFSNKDSKVNSNIMISRDMEYCYGISIDVDKRKLYWTTDSQIYRSEIDGTARETLLNTTSCKLV